MVPMAAGKRSYGHMSSDPGIYPSDSKRHQSSFRRNANNLDSSRNALLSSQQSLQQQQQQSQQQQELFRILCPASRIGSVIGKGGSIIKALRQQTGAKIKIADAIPGSDERVIIIGAFDSDGDDDYPAGGSGALLDRDDRGLDDYTNGRDIACPAQLALFKVHCRILDADKFDDDLDDPDDVEDDFSEKVVTRMLVPENQVGCLLGKRGRIIEQMREETGSQIRILPREQLPVCALATDEVVQVVGDRPSVKRALNAISTRLLENPPKDRPSSAAFQSNNFGGSRASIVATNEAFMQHSSLVPPSRQRNEPRNDSLDAGYQLLRPTAPSLSEFGTGRHLVPAEEELIFRILFPSTRIENIFSVIQTLRDETGAKIIVADEVPNCDERVIIVSAVESPDEDLSPAQEAVFHIQDKTREAPDSNVSENIVTRLLVPSNQVGCLLGKGGTIITEMRKSTRAIIRVLDKDQLPRCALDHDEVVQVSGEIRVARDALVQITSRLRANLYREKTDSRSDDYGYQRAASPFGLQGGQSSSIQPSRTPPNWLLQQADRGGYNSLGPSIPGLGSYSVMDRSYGLAGDRPALSGGLGNLSVVTSTKIEVLIPEVTVPAVLGQSGDNLTQISKMSGAKVSLADGYTSSGDRLIEISGAPDQTNIAKTLVEAFVVTGNKRS